jgi:hypothetical protein
VNIKCEKNRNLLIFIGVFIFIFLIILYINNFSKQKINQQKSTETYQEELIKESRENPEIAFANLRRILKEVPTAYSKCHELVHEMGHASYEAFGFKKAMEYQDSICGGGYIHGILESAFGFLHENEILKNIKTLCGSNGTCIHGLGHGLMIATKEDTKKSLNFCSQIPFKEKTNCYDGVFMYSFDQEETGIQRKNMTKEEASNLCEQAPVYTQKNCYFYFPRVLWYQKNLESKIVCDELKNENSKIFCFIGYGTMLMKYHETFNLEEVISQCTLIENIKYRNFCIDGARKYAQFHTEGL